MMREPEKSDGSTAARKPSNTSGKRGLRVAGANGEDRRECGRDRHAPDDEPQEHTCGNKTRTKASKTREPVSNISEPSEQESDSDEPDEAQKVNRIALPAHQ